MAIEEIITYSIVAVPVVLGVVALAGHQQPFLEYGRHSKQIVRDHGRKETRIEPTIYKSRSLPKQVKVLTANLSGGRGRSFHHFDHLLICDLIGYHRWKGDVSTKGIEAMKELLSNGGVDIAFFQEIQRGHARGDDQVAELSKEFHYGFRPNVTHSFLRIWDLHHGDAIMTKVPQQEIVGSSFEPHRRLGFSTFTDLLVGSKGFTRSRVHYNHHSVYLYSTHCSSIPKDRETRAREMQALFEDIASDHYPAIIGGDLNIVPRGSQLREFPINDNHYATAKRKVLYEEEQTWEVIRTIAESNGLTFSYNHDLPLFEEPGTILVPGTYHGDIPTLELGCPLSHPDLGQRIDYVMAVNRMGNPLQIKFIGEKIHDDIAYSDHKPVSAIFEFELDGY